MDSTNDAITADAVAQLHRKQERRAFWSKIGGALLLLAITVRFAGALLKPAEAPACDASDVRSTLGGLVNGLVVKGGGKATVTAIDRIAAGAGDDKLRHCTGHVMLTDKSEGTLTYRVEPKQVVIETLQ